eukprot:gene10178-8084_t
MLHGDSLYISCQEVFCEQVADLLVDQAPLSPKLDGTPYMAVVTRGFSASHSTAAVAPACQLAVASLEEAVTVAKVACARRQTACHPQSSHPIHLGHMVVTLTWESPTAPGGHATCSLFDCCSSAASLFLTPKGAAVTKKSLLSLGKALASAHRGEACMALRESKLTRMLSGSVNHITLLACFGGDLAMPKSPGGGPSPPLPSLADEPTLQLLQQVSVCSRPAQQGARASLSRAPHGRSSTASTRVKYTLTSLEALEPPSGPATLVMGPITPDQLCEDPSLTMRVKRAISCSLQGVSSHVNPTSSTAASAAPLLHPRPVHPSPPPAHQLFTAPSKQPSDLTPTSGPTLTPLQLCHSPSSSTDPSTPSLTPHSSAVTLTAHSANATSHATNAPRLGKASCSRIPLPPGSTPRSPPPALRTPSRSPYTPHVPPSLSVTPLDRTPSRSPYTPHGPPSLSLTPLERTPSRSPYTPHVPPTVSYAPLVLELIAPALGPAQLSPSSSITFDTHSCGSDAWRSVRGSVELRSSAHSRASADLEANGKGWEGHLSGGPLTGRSSTCNSAGQVTLIGRNSSSNHTPAGSETQLTGRKSASHHTPLGSQTQLNGRNSASHHTDLTVKSSAGHHTPPAHKPPLPGKNPSSNHTPPAQQPKAAPVSSNPVQDMAPTHAHLTQTHQFEESKLHTPTTSNHTHPAQQLNAAPVSSPTVQDMAPTHAHPTQTHQLKEGKAPQAKEGSTHTSPTIIPPSQPHQAPQAKEGSTHTSPTIIPPSQPHQAPQAKEGSTHTSPTIIPSSQPHQVKEGKLLAPLGPPRPLSPSPYIQHPFPKLAPHLLDPASPNPPRAGARHGHPPSTAPLLWNSSTQYRRCLSAHARPTPSQATPRGSRGFNRSPGQSRSPPNPAVIQGNVQTNSGALPVSAGSPHTPTQPYMRTYQRSNSTLPGSCRHHLRRSSDTYPTPSVLGELHQKLQGEYLSLLADFQSFVTYSQNTKGRLSRCSTPDSFGRLSRCSTPERWGGPEGLLLHSWTAVARSSARASSSPAHSRPPGYGYSPRVSSIMSSPDLTAIQEGRHDDRADPYGLNFMPRDLLQGMGTGKTLQEQLTQMDGREIEGGSFPHDTQMDGREIQVISSQQDLMSRQEAGGGTGDRRAGRDLPSHPHGNGVAGGVGAPPPSMLTPDGKDGAGASATPQPGAASAVGSLPPNMLTPDGKDSSILRSLLSNGSEGSSTMSTPASQAYLNSGIWAGCMSLQEQLRRMEVRKTTGMKVMKKVEAPPALTPAAAAAARATAQGQVQAQAKAKAQAAATAPAPSRGQTAGSPAGPTAPSRSTLAARYLSSLSHQQPRNGQASHGQQGGVQTGNLSHASPSVSPATPVLAGLAQQRGALASGGSVQQKGASASTPVSAQQRGAYASTPVTAQHGGAYAITPASAQQRGAYAGTPVPAQQGGGCASMSQAAGRHAVPAESLKVAGSSTWIRKHQKQPTPVSPQESLYERWKQKQSIAGRPGQPLQPRTIPLQPIQPLLTRTIPLSPQPHAANSIQSKPTGVSTVSRASSTSSAGMELIASSTLVDRSLSPCAMDTASFSQLRANDRLLPLPKALRGSAWNSTLADRSLSPSPALDTTGFSQLREDEHLLPLPQMSTWDSTLDQTSLSLLRDDEQLLPLPQISTWDSTLAGRSLSPSLALDTTGFSHLQDDERLLLLPQFSTCDSNLVGRSLALDTEGFSNLGDDESLPPLPQISTWDSTLVSRSLSPSLALDRRGFSQLRDAEHLLPIPKALRGSAWDSTLADRSLSPSPALDTTGFSQLREDEHLLPLPQGMQGSSRESASPYIDRHFGSVHGWRGRSGYAHAERHDLRKVNGESQGGSDSGGETGHARVWRGRGDYGHGESPSLRESKGEIPPSQWESHSREGGRDQGVGHGQESYSKGSSPSQGKMAQPQAKAQAGFSDFRNDSLAPPPQQLKKCTAAFAALHTSSQRTRSPASRSLKDSLASSSMGGEDFLVLSRENSPAFSRMSNALRIQSMGGEDCVVLPREDSPASSIMNDARRLLQELLHIQTLPKLIVCLTVTTLD